jgi:hypothetical protein
MELNVENTKLERKSSAWRLNECCMSDVDVNRTRLKNSNFVMHKPHGGWPNFPTRRRSTPKDD